MKDEFTSKKLKLQEELKGLEARLAQVIKSTDAAEIEEKFRLFAKISTVVAQIKAIDSFMAFQASVDEFGGEVNTTLSEVLKVAKGFRADLLETGNSFLQKLKDRAASFGVTDVVEETKQENRFQSIVDLVKEGKTSDAYMQLRVIESESELGEAGDDQMFHVLRIVECLIKKDREAVAVAVLAALYEQQ